MKISCTIAAAFLLAASVASAQQFPSKSIRLVVPYPPGGVGFVSRILGQKLGEAWGQNVIIDNRPGGDTIIGSEIVARAAPDGYVLLMAYAAHVVNPSVRKKLPFDPVADFVPITLAAQYPYLIVVHPTVPARSIKELVALARAKPNTLTSGTSGALPQLAAGWIYNLTGIKITNVPYKGSAPALIDLVGGHVDLTFTTAVEPLPFIRSGRLRVLAVTSRTRVDFLPEVPAVSETGIPDYDVIGWLGVLAPAGTPREIVLRLNAELTRILRLAETKDQFLRNALQPAGNSPEEFAGFLKDEAAKWRKVVKLTGFKVE